uniref:Uncharacterized protein n=1 Tax=Spongospora subterranea TaxID=70186 RepID=A0A0H5R359_9EUKA|eukprot:CRZ08292.1 hypothetical protein [Spongospora subterranea]
MRKSSNNPGGVPEFLYLHPELHDAVDCRLDVPPLLYDWATAAYPDCIIDLNDLFCIANERRFFVESLVSAGLWPISLDNMTAAFLFLQTQRAAIAPMLSND